MASEKTHDEAADIKLAAKAFSQLGASKGGKARAQKLTAEERREIAIHASETRWGKVKEDGTLRPVILRATHGAADHPLKIHNLEISCYVLEDGTRVITNRGLQRSLGMAESGGAQRLADLMERFRLKGVDTKDLSARILSPIEFRPLRAGRSAYGYEATVLADICEVILAARELKVLTKQYEPMAEHCELLVRGFARVGIIALVDEATGYEKDKPKDDLRRLLEAYIRQGELMPSDGRFPIDYYREIFRLYGWDFDEKSSKRPRIITAITSEYIYKKLPPGVYEKIKELNPPVYKGGSRRHRHYQFLTDDVGDPHLKNQIVAVTTLLGASESWPEFKKLFRRRFPCGDSRQNELKLLDPLGGE